MEPPVLTDGPVGVRPVRGSDAPALGRLAEDPEVRRRSRWAPVACEAEEAWAAASLHGWASPSRLVLALSRHEPGRQERCAGLVVLQLDERGGGEVACALLPDERGRGTASAGLRLLLTWAFAELGLHVVRWRSEVGHWAWRRVAWACGFTVEGTSREALADGEDHRDAWLGSLRWDDRLQPRTPWLTASVLRGGGLRLGPAVPADVARLAQACAAASTQAWLPGLPSPYTVLDAASYLASRAEQAAEGTGVSWVVRGDASGPGTAGRTAGGTAGGTADGHRGAWRAAPSGDSGEDVREDALGHHPGVPADVPADVTDLLAEVALFRVERGGAGVASAEVGYWCHPDARRRGVTSTALALVTAHALAPAEHGGMGLERLVLRAARGNTASARVAQKAGFTATGTDRGAERLRDGRRVDFLRFDLLAGEVGPGGVAGATGGGPSAPSSGGGAAGPVILGR